MKKEFYISLGIFIPFAFAMTFFYYSNSGDLLRSIVFGCFSMLSIFFVPYLFRSIKKRVW